MTKEVRILLIGPRTNLDKNLVGGATTSFEQLVTFFTEKSIDFKIINTQKYMGIFQNLRNFFHVIFATIFSFHKIDVIFLNASQGGVKRVAPVVFLIARLAGKKFVLRPFGGNFGEYTNLLKGFNKWLFYKTIPYSDLIFLQTKALVNQFENRQWKVAWLPTSRAANKSSTEMLRKLFSKKFIYAGSIHPDKGIPEILKVFGSLNSTYIVHLYGPLPEKHNELLSGQDELYKGVLSNESLRKKLLEYDVLLLPTYYAGEGYPGIIIEAYAAGLPVISTNWRSIPEVVENGKSGILIDPRNEEQLKKAVLSFNSSNYETFVNHARQLFNKNFDSEKVLSELVEHIFSLVKN